MSPMDKLVLDDLCSPSEDYRLIKLWIPLHEHGSDPCSHSLLFVCKNATDANDIYHVGKYKNHS